MWLCYCVRAAYGLQNIAARMTYVAQPPILFFIPLFQRDFRIDLGVRGKAVVSCRYVTHY